MPDQGNRLTDMEYDEVSLVTVPANQVADVVLWKSADQEAPVAEQETLPADVQEYVNELEKSVVALEEKVAELSKSDGEYHEDEEDEDEEMEKLLKSADPRLAEIVKTATERATAAEMVAKSERDHRLNTDFISKVTEDFDTLPTDYEELGKALKVVADNVPEDVFKTVYDNLLKASGVLGNVTDEIGKTGSGEATFVDEITKVYNRFKDEPTYEGLSKEQVVTKALTTNPNLASEIQTEGK